MNDSLSPIVLDMVTMLSRKFAVYLRSNKQRVKWLYGLYVGTVYSGDPTRTTFGNTLRVWLYSEYVCFLAQIDKFSLAVAGDDALTTLEAEVLPEFEVAFW